MAAGPTSLMVLGLTPPPVPEDEVPTWRWWLETAIVAALGLAAVCAPLALGGTPTRVRYGLDVLVALAAIAWVVSAPRSGWLAWIPVAAAATVALQVVPLPISLLAWLAPASAAAWRVVGEGNWLDWGTISVDPGATAEGMRHLLLGLATIVVVADLCRERWRRHLLIGAIALSGAVIWALALAFPMNDERVLFGGYSLRGPEPSTKWTTTVLPPVRTAGFSTDSGYVTVPPVRYLVPRWGVGDGIGSYVVSNHFAGGLYLTIPLLLGICRRRWRGPVWGWGGAALSLLVFGAAVWTTGAQAHSRAGTGSMLLAAIVFMLLSSETRWARRLWLGGLALAALVLVGFALVFFQVAPSLADLLPAEIRDRLLAALASDGRRELSHVAMQTFFSSPLFGVGLGCFGFFDAVATGRHGLAFFAHNDYAQFLAETGLVGGVVLAAILAVFGIALFRVRALPTRERMLAAGVWSALAGIALHSFYDWNLHLPANRLLACLAAGLALALVPVVPVLRPSRRDPSPLVPIPGGDSADPVVPWSPRRGIAAVVLAGACVATAFFSVRDARTEYARVRLRTGLTNLRTAATDDQRTLAYGRLKWGVARARAVNRHHATDSEIALLAGQAILHLDAAGEGLEGEDAGEWFDLARRRNPLRRGLPEPLDGPARPASEPTDEQTMVTVPAAGCG